RVVRVAVTFSHLARGQRRPPLCPPPHDLVSLVQQPPVEQLFQRPPHALDITLVIGDVGILEVNPEADPVGELLPLALVPEDGIDASSVKALDPVFFDGGLSSVDDSEFLAYLDFDRQT